MPTNKSTISACWISWDETTIEQLTLHQSAHEFLIDSQIWRIKNEDRSSKSATVDYQISCDASWHVRSFQVECTEPKRTLIFTSDGNGNWSDATGMRPEFAGSIDIDITATPFTNTLPIRRLNLAIGDSQLIKVLYIKTPELKLSLDEQRYTRIGGNRYRFEQIATGFTRELEVDENGLVLDYQDLFRRVK